MRGRPPPQLHKHIDLDHDLDGRELPHLGQLLQPLDVEAALKGPAISVKRVWNW